MFFRVLQQEMEAVSVTSSLPHQPNCEQPRSPLCTATAAWVRERKMWARTRCGQEGAGRGRELIHIMDTDAHVWSHVVLLHFPIP